MIIAKPVFNHPASPPTAWLGAITEYGLPATGSYSNVRPVKKIWRARRPGEANCCENCACGSACTGCPDPGVYGRSGVHGLGAFEIFESPVWTHRKWIVLGGVALIGLSLLAGGAALLR